MWYVNHDYRIVAGLIVLFLVWLMVATDAVVGCAAGEYNDAPRVEHCHCHNNH